MDVARGSGSSCGGRRSSLTFSMRILFVCIFFVSLQSFVQLSRLTNKEKNAASENAIFIPATTKTLFTPDEFRAGRFENYINLPTIYNPDRDQIVKQLMERPVPEPTEILLHMAPTPPSGNAILGLASYPTFKDGWLKMVGSLRTNGYDGHIIVGVHPDIPQEERDYLDKMGGEFVPSSRKRCAHMHLNVSSPCLLNTSMFDLLCF